MALGTTGLNTMANGIKNVTSLQLVATVGATEEATATVTFGSATGGVINITTAAGGGGDVTLTIPDTLTTPFEISHVYLREVGETLANHIAVQALSSNNAFPSGGDLIVTSFEITVE